TSNSRLRSPIAWPRLKLDQVNRISQYLFSQSACKEFEQFLSAITDSQSSAIQLNWGHPAALKWLGVFLRQHKPLDTVLKDLRQASRRSLASRNQSGPLQHGITPTSLLKACELFVSSGQVGKVLEVLRALSLTGVQLNVATLEKLAAALSEMDHTGIARAADILRRYPATRFLSALKGAWISFERAVRVEHDKPITELPPYLDAAANAVAAALGACAACDRTYTSLANDETATEVATREKVNNLIGEYNRRATQYKSQGLGEWHGAHKPKTTLLEEMKGLETEIEGITKRMDHLHSSHSAGYLLLTVLRNAQLYPTSIRQGAAWGLKLLCDNGHLDAATKLDLLDTIRSCVAGDDRDSFCERTVRLLPGIGTSEMAEALGDGVQWMTRLVQGSDAEIASQSAASAEFKKTAVLQQRKYDEASEYERLARIVDLMCEMLPGALAFLEKYPLRLMPLDVHKRVLGYLSTSRCRMTYWTRYTPPLRIGRVHRRYLTLDDRSMPNSMGIYYNLFRHPVLALPVIYHEFMHYGGPEGDPTRGIANEAEVLLREIIFARYLIAKLAPTDDPQIPEFEEVLVEEIERASMVSLRLQLTWDFEDDAALTRLNEQIANIYGVRLNEAQIQSRLAHQIMLDNLNTEIANEIKIDGWNNEITWPELGKPDTLELTGRYKSVLSRQWRHNHLVSPSDRDRLLREPACMEHIRGWEAYVRRPRALDRLSVRWLASLEDLIMLIAGRFDLSDATET
ncbi:MAG TPA: hypothetical protein VJX67_09515, partial [Blastocatellia bacterium]|nr:hypothetical protein [Blastocatellia bacterium]